MKKNRPESCGVGRLLFKALVSVVLLLAASVSGAFAQSTIDVTGKVIDADGQPVVGASVVVAGTYTGTTTGADGGFALKAREGQELEVSFIGMSTQRVPVSAVPVTVTLESESTMIEQAVVIGYGTAKKRDLTGSIVNVDAAQHVHPRLFPHITGMSDIAFLAGILLLFAGVEVHAVHAPELAKPQTQFPRAMFLAALISFGLFTLGALAVAIITPYDQINLQSGLFTTFQIAFERYHVGWLSNVMGLLVAFGALAGVMSWISGPSRGLLWTAKDGALPCFLQKTNKNGVQINILIIQGCIVTLLSSLYIVMDDVSVAFFLLSALTVGLYLIMYMMMYAAGIRLRYTQPKLIRSYRVPGGNTGMWLIGGVGFLAVLFSFIVTFFPPSQLPVGSPATYTWLVVTGTAVFLAIPFIISFSMDKRNARRTPEA